MSNDAERYREWEILEPSSSFEKHFRSRPDHINYIPEFESDVTTNPFRSPRGRIVRIQQTKGRYREGVYRWKKSDLRIVYFPEKANHTIYPLDAGTAANIGYKKRS